MINIKSSKEFRSKIEEYVQEGLTYFEALLEYSHKYEVEIETVAGLVNQIPSLKEKLASELETLNLIEKSEDRLPF